MRVEGFENNLDQAMRVLKRKLQRDGFFREMRGRMFFTKPSEERKKERAAAVKRQVRAERRRRERDR